MKLEEILSEGEGYRQEFKEGLARIDRAMVGFANAGGGTIYVGVRDDGTILKTPLNNRLRAQIANIAAECDPAVPITIAAIGPIVAVSVPEGEDKPYSCKDGFFLRNGATTQKLTRQEMLEFVVRVNRVQFDRLIAASVIYPRDVAKAAVRRFVAEASLETVLADVGQEQFLQSLGVAQRQRGRLLLNHAGVLFFAKHPQLVIPHATAGFTRYQGVDKTTVVERKLYRGTLIEQIMELLRDLQRAIPTGYGFDRELRRQDLPHYPLVAVREAVLNAVMHRDYFENGAEISVDLYADRLEITNPGELLPVLSLETLGQRSLRRNPLIGDLLYRCGWVEKLGSGIQRMRRLMDEWRLKPPFFTSGGGFFSVTLFGPKTMIDVTALPQLAERERQFLAEQNRIDEPFASRVYQSRFAVTLRTAQKDLTHLVQTGHLTREGNGKNARYRFRS
ncbi:MAG: putative DNA binding domain-containing protein [Deltaproteobacteria bacterium]|nr:putative DNA binding domain-containing protein [Deltaproteobacteria bacterium]